VRIGYAVALRPLLVLVWHHPNLLPRLLGRLRRKLGPDSVATFAVQGELAREMQVAVEIGFVGVLANIMDVASAAHH